jgi:outer membrane receptor protein involved in Fe transport
MFQLKPVVRGIALAFGGSVALLAAAGPALAQQAAQQPPAQQDQTLERAVVTGTRIVSEGAESASPLQQITSKDIQDTGAVNIQNVILSNPTVGTPGVSRTNSNFQTSSVGVATIDLRDLGSDRTLVLVNGRRFVPGIPGSAAIDLNVIPTQFIERVDILTGGQSALYGSDAVAGVVNIVYKRNFTGLALDAQYGESFEGDDTQKSASMTFGTSNDRGNIMAHIGLSKQGAVYSRDRDFAAVDQISTGLLTGDPNDLFTARRPFYSSFAPQGRFFYAGGNRTFDAQGNLIPFSTNGPAGDGVGATGFNRSQFRTIAVPVDRNLFAASGEYEMFKSHSAYFEGTYARTKSVSELEPFPLDSADGTNGIYPGGFVPAQFLVNGVLRNNPVIPASLFALLSDRDGDGAVDYNFTRRLSEFGNRGNDADRNTFRLLGGFKGDITGTWKYDAYVGYGVTSESQVGGGQVNVLNFRNALEAVPDVDDVNGNGNTTEAICRDSFARTQGCVPINIFGFNTISPEALKYITAPTLYTTDTRQNIAGLTFTGEAAQLAAGPVGVAAGLEYRKEYSRSTFDPLAQAGLNAGNAIPETKGGFDVTEFFVEGRLPILKDQPFAKMLAASASGRWGDYSTVGNVFSYSLGLEWAPNNDLKFRATNSLSTRAPNIGELFTPPSQTFPTGLSDPCEGVTATTPGTLGDRCRAAPGVAANIAANGAFTLNQADIQGISGFDRGNPDAQEEEGNSWTIGFVFTPSNIQALRNTAFTIDYFDIKVDDALVSTPRQFILDQCYTGDASFCQFLTRRPTAVGANSSGSLNTIDSTVTNSGGLRTKGIDLTAVYSDRLGPGRFDGRFSWTHYLEGYVIPLPGAEKDEYVGEIGSPENKWTLSLGYTWDKFGVTLRNTYIGESALDDQFLAGFDLAPGSVTVDGKHYTDIQFTYQANKWLNVYAGIDNVFDTSPAPIISGLPGNTTGAETAADVYDAIGPRYYLGVRMSF